MFECKISLNQLVKQMDFQKGRKIFSINGKCNISKSTPDHLLTCLGLEKEDLRTKKNTSCLGFSLCFRTHRTGLVN